MGYKKRGVFTFVGILIGVMVFIVFIYPTIDYIVKRQQEYDVFSDNQAVFEKVKEDIAIMIDSLNKADFTYKSYNFYKHHSVVAEGMHRMDVDDEFKDEYKDIKVGLDKIYALTPKKFDFVSYINVGDDAFTSFVFDWEAGYGNSFRIIYAKTPTILATFYETNEIRYKIKKLADNWYGVVIEPSLFN